MEELFSEILDNDEKIVKTFKPNPKRFVDINIIKRIIMNGLLFLIIFVPFLFVPMDAEQYNQVFTMLIVLSCILGLAIIYDIVSPIVRYNKTVYAITNKKVIVRTGFIGVDYKSLELKSIGAINVRVDFLDKLTHSTGSLYFGSASAPVNEQSSFCFRYIDKPYDVYKEVKELIEENKTENK